MSPTLLCFTECNLPPSSISTGRECLWVLILSHFTERNPLPSSISTVRECHLLILTLSLFNPFLFSTSTGCEFRLFWVPHFTEHNPPPYSISTVCECHLWIIIPSHFTESNPFPFSICTVGECRLWLPTLSHYTERNMYPFLQDVSVIYESSHCLIFLIVIRFSRWPFPQRVSVIYVSSHYSYRWWFSLVLDFSLSVYSSTLSMPSLICHNLGTYV